LAIRIKRNEKIELKRKKTLTNNGKLKTTENRFKNRNSNMCLFCVILTQKDKNLKKKNVNIREAIIVIKKTLFT